MSADSGLIVAAHVCDDNQDRQQLAPTVAAIPATVGPIHTVIADTGYDNHQQIVAVEQTHGATVYVPPQQPFERDDRVRKRKRTARMAERAARSERVRSAAGQALMRLRRCVVEPVFGTLRAAWHFRRFQLRGLAGVNSEWTLLCTAYNLRKLHRWRLAQA